VRELARRRDAAGAGEIELASVIDGRCTGIGVGAAKSRDGIGLDDDRASRPAAESAVGYDAVVGADIAGERQRLRSERNNTGAGRIEQATDARARCGLRYVKCRGASTAT